jgi:hypothetical protein
MNGAVHFPGGNVLPGVLFCGTVFGKPLRVSVIAVIDSIEGSHNFFSCFLRLPEKPDRSIRLKILINSKKGNNRRTAAGNSQFNHELYEQADIRSAQTFALKFRNDTRFLFAVCREVRKKGLCSGPGLVMFFPFVMVRVVRTEGSSWFFLALCLN